MVVSRVAYIKCGDVAGEAARYLESGSKALTSSPDAFTHAVLDVRAGRPALLLGAHGSGECWRRGNTQVIDLGSGFAHRPMRMLVDLTALVRTLRRFRPTEVVCGASGPMFWATALAARLGSAKLVYCQHVRLNEPEGRFARRLRKWFDRALIRRADVVLAHGPYLEAQLREAGVPRERIVRFEMAFDGDAEDLGPRSKGGGRYVLFVGRMERLKGVFDLLEACEPLLRRDPQLRLKFAGAGSVGPEVEARVAASTLGRQIDVLGAVPHPAVAELMRGAEVVVTPTRQAFPEGRCMAALEALVYGTPVIAPDFGPFPYLIDDGVTGLLYAPDSVAELEEALRRVLSDERLRAALRQGARAAGAGLRHPACTFVDALRGALDGAAHRVAGVCPGGEAAR